uniref:Phosphatase and actin regulator n=1 Tax=Eptatretus burgeri TaxID=7764 RepID=A0A8C4R0K8_EPTBU
MAKTFMLCLTVPISPNLDPTFPAFYSLRSSVAHHDQKRKLERSKTEDCLKRKLHSRPARSELLERHILQDSALQLKQKRTRLAEELNEKISQRPGPLELLHKNILAVPTRSCDTRKLVLVHFELFSLLMTLRLCF